ncbi:MAG: MFS transporter, partial [Chloroflexi bacterium]
PTWGLSSPPTIGLLLASVGLIIGFVRWEQRAAAPMVDLSMFNDRLFSAALASSVLAYLAIFMLNLLVPFYLIHGLGFDYFHAGILLTPVPVAMVMFAPISGWLSDKVGSRALTSGGMLLVAASFYWLSRLGLHPDYAQLVPPLLLNGIGTGLFTSPNNSAVMGAASRGHAWGPQRGYWPPAAASAWPLAPQPPLPSSPCGCRPTSPTTSEQRWRRSPRTRTVSWWPAPLHSSPRRPRWCVDQRLRQIGRLDRSNPRRSGKLDTASAAPRRPAGSDPIRHRSL